MEEPELIIVGGANGSGKTTLIREIVSKTGILYLGADEIAAELNEENPENDAIKAARIFSRRLGEGIEKGESLLVESTLSGVSLKKFIEKARAKGFRMTIYHIYLDSAQLCIRRIASRVALGGHHVPETDVRRRFLRSNKNFWNLYKDMTDSWSLIFNAGDYFQPVAAGDANGIIILDEARFTEWQKMVKS